MSRRIGHLIAEPVKPIRRKTKPLRRVDLPGSNGMQYMLTRELETSIAN
jgi:hypothetical protein